MKSVRSRSSHYSYLVVLLWLIELELFHAAEDHIHTLTPGTVMRDFDYLESPNELFRLKFFYVGDSSNHYLGIELMGYEKIVWVANKDNPFNDTSGVLNITEDGNLLLSNRHGICITLNSESPAMSSNTSATLLDSGNFILKAGDEIVWQSFDYPSDTILPGMKLGLFAALNSRHPREHLLTSWMSTTISAPGTFSVGVDPNNTNQLVIWRRGKLYWHSGNRNGHNFTYFPAYSSFYDLTSSKMKFSYISNNNESYYTYYVPPTYISFFAINPSGEIRFFLAGNDGFSNWYLSCDAEEENGPKGCIDQKPSKCSSGYQFLQKYGFLDSWEYLDNVSLGLNDCKEMCRNNCSCKAYGSGQPDGTGCKFSYDQNPHISEFVGEPFYLRNSSIILKNTTRTIKNTTRTKEGM